MRDPGQIPESFRRSETGTSIFVVAYRHHGGDWADSYIREAVENFWPAIHRSSLVFHIGDRRVDATTLPTLMALFSGDPDFASRSYYRAVVNQNRHDKWDANRAENAAEAKRVLQNVRDWINQSLRELNPDENAREADVPELNRYLPDEEDEPLADDSEAPTERGGEDGIVTAPVAQLPIIQEVAPRPPTRRPARGDAAPEDGNEEGEGTGDGNPDPGDGENETDGGQSATTGGGSSGENRPRETKTLLQRRSVRSGSDTYDLIVRSADARAGRLALVSVGEDNKEDKDLRITRVLEASSGSEFALDSFSIEEGQTLRLRVTIDSTVPVSLRAYCHGN